MFPIVLPRPASDCPELRELCERLVPGEIPVQLEIEHPPGAKVNDCFANVERLVAEYGGGIEYGWQLWETLPGVMLEAEFHAVWLDRAGGRREVTPKEQPVDHTVFLPDPTCVYEGRQVNNVRVALRDDPLVHDFIATADLYYEETNRDELAHLHGDIAPYLTPAQKTRIVALQKRLVQLEQAIRSRYL